MNVAVIPCIAKGELTKFTSVVKLFRADFIFSLLFLIFEHIPLAFAFRKYYLKRAPYVRMSLILTLMQFVFSTMILSELYSHYPMAVFSDSYTGYLITSETPEAVPSDQFEGYFTKGNVDYRSTTLAFYLVVSCWLQLAKLGEVYHRVRRLKGYKMYGTSHRSGKLEGEKLLDAREVGQP